MRAQKTFLTQDVTVIMINGETDRYRFVNEAQLSKMTNFSLPALIVPLGCGVGDEGAWIFHTTEGQIPCPVSMEVGREMMEQPKGVWRFVSGGTAMCVQSTGQQEEFNSFAHWLVEHDYPFDRIE